MADHGTLGRYKKHIRDKDEPCGPCLIANREDGRKRRRTMTPELERYYKNKSIARSRALTRLSHMFSVEYYLIFEEEFKLQEAQNGTGSSE